MDNQHKLIKGYRDLSKAEIDLMNRIKAKGEELRSLTDELDGLSRAPFDPDSLHPRIDGRWVSIGTTHLQQGVMALVRAVAQPESF